MFMSDESVLVAKKSYFPSISFAAGFSLQTKSIILVSVYQLC